MANECRKVWQFPGFTRLTVRIACRVSAREDLRFLASKETDERLGSFLDQFVNSMANLDRLKHIMETAFRSLPPDPTIPASTAERTPLPDFEGIKRTMRDIKNLSDKQKLIREKILDPQKADGLSSNDQNES
jgi:hypothetical protein